VVWADAFLHAGIATSSGLRRYADERPHWPNVRKVRAACNVRENRLFRAFTARISPKSAPKLRVWGPLAQAKATASIAMTRNSRAR
jgi:hypothetical protein